MKQESVTIHPYNTYGKTKISVEIKAVAEKRKGITVP
jgi:hypothetical protein